jgi:hypothetical protein
LSNDKYNGELRKDEEEEKEAHLSWKFLSHSKNSLDLAKVETPTHEDDLTTENHDVTQRNDNGKN